MRYDAEHKRRTRDRVLEVAAEAIRAEGPHRLGVAEVMSRAGLTHGGFYAHFTSRDDLVTAAISRTFEEGFARLDHETAGRAPAEALSHYIDFYLSAAHRDAPGSGCPIPALSADLPRLPAAAQRTFAAGVRRLRETLAGHIRGLGVDDAQGQAASVLAEMVGALGLARAEPEPARSDGLLAASRRAVKQRLGLPATPGLFTR